MTSRPATAHAAAPAMPGSQQLLQDKLRIPRLSVTVLRRGRLTELIEQAAAHRVTLVSGPAGVGKTVACASWAAGPSGSRRAGWLTLDPLDGEPGRLWRYVQAALSRIRPVPADVFQPLRHMPAADFPLGLAAAAQQLTEPAFLVLDDVHELADSPALAGLDLLIRHAPPNLRLVLSGRCQPGLQLARLRVAGELAEIGAAEMACTAAEADAFFALHGVPVDGAERDELLRRTEGWMAGLRLAVLRVRGGGWERGSVTDIGGDEPILTDYMWDEVLGRQAPDTRLFLLRTSIADRMSGDLADALTGGADGARTLDRLSRENSLVDPLGHDSSEYRYHPLLRDVLVAELHRELPQEIPVLLGRAARWFSAHGDGRQAVRAAAQAGEWDYAAEVLVQAGTAALLQGGAAELDEVLFLFPPARRSGDSAVAAALAAARLWNGDPDGAAGHLAAARRGLGHCSQEARRVIEPWLAALEIMHAAGRGEADPAALAAAWALAERAEAAASLQPEHGSIGLLWFALGCAQLRHFEVREASYALGRADRQFAAAGLGWLRPRTRAWRALADAWYGDLAAAEAAVSDVLHGAAAGDGEDQAAASVATLAAAQVSLVRDDLAAARKLLDDAAEHTACRLPGEPRMATAAALIRVRTVLADGDAAGARGLLLRLREAAGPDDQPLDRVLTVLDCQLALQAGGPDRAREVVPDEEQQARLCSADGRLLRGRLLLAEGSWRGAIDAVGPCLDGSAASITLLAKVGGLLVAATALRRLERPAEAAELLEQALALAEPDGARRPFLDGGPAVRSAITVLITPTSRSAGFAGRLLERFDSQLPGADAAASAVVPLTDSELAVLRFLPSHMTNQEIADALFLSINTVKTHLRSAYRKLGAASRREAIACGRRHGLI
ncbi:MAG: LuxR C-terminal-related transcriptional regulator [Streptosporangiaceae bacterium]|jgi:LuxR family maltose regulon positive regulatory protein